MSSSSVSFRGGDECSDADEALGDVADPETVGCLRTASGMRPSEALALGSLGVDFEGFSRRLSNMFFVSFWVLAAPGVIRSRCRFLARTDSFPFERDGTG